MPNAKLVKSRLSKGASSNTAHGPPAISKTASQVLTPATVIAQPAKRARTGNSQSTASVGAPSVAPSVAATDGAQSEGVILVSDDDADTSDAEADPESELGMSPQQPHRILSLTCFA